MRKILVFKIPAKLVLEAAGRKIEEEKKSFESRVTSSTKLCIPSTINTQLNLIFFGFGRSGCKLKHTQSIVYAIVSVLYVVLGIYNFKALLPKASVCHF